MPDLDEGALLFGDHAYLETRGSTADRVTAAIWGYLWALENVQEIGEMMVWPSLNDLRRGLAEDGPDVLRRTSG